MSDGNGGIVHSWFASYLDVMTVSSMFVADLQVQRLLPYNLHDIPQGSVIGPIFLLYTTNLLGLVDMHGLIRPHLFAVQCFNAVCTSNAFSHEPVNSMELHFQNI